MGNHGSTRGFRERGSEERDSSEPTEGCLAAAEDVLEPRRDCMG
jgi:hypothetical protein